MPDRPAVHVVPNGIDVEAFRIESGDRQRIRRELGVSDHEIVVGTVAVMRPQKRLDLWLQTLRHVVDQGVAVIGLIVGDGPLRADLERHAAELSLTGRVRFPGLQSPIAPWLAAMDLFLITSEFEGLPLALLEAMASRLPVVATAVGGIPEVIEDGRSGVLVPIPDPRWLAERARELLLDPERRREMGLEAKRRVEREFSVERMAQELEREYRGCVEGTAG
jgi:glycosyltransferase involved in cell wall biosynthesis